MNHIIRVQCELDLIATYEEAQSLSLREVCEKNLVRGRHGDMASPIVLSRWAKNGRRVSHFVVEFPAVKVHGTEYRVMPSWVTWHNRKVIELLNPREPIEIKGNPKKEKKNAQAAIERLRKEGMKV